LVTDKKVTFDSETNKAVEMTFFLQKDAYNTENIERSVVTVGFASKHPTGAVRFDVTLDTLPYQAISDGFEVVAQFRVKDMKTDKTFYTDSNGLDMQKRVKDYRPSWNFSYPDSYQKENVTANYYPINSAIAVEDDNIRLTVLNDRSQGGSSLEDGTVELMHNRKIHSDDNKGVGEFLEEHNQYGRGIRVKASYHMVISKAGDSVAQRKTQIAIENPMQYFFSDSAEIKETDEVSMNLPARLAKYGVQAPVRMLTYPLGENKIMIRFDNLHDAESKKVDLFNIGIDMWEYVNPGVAAQIAFSEVSITGNMFLQDMKDRKIKWNYKGKTAPKAEQKVDGDEFEVEPMGIRTFVASYTVKGEETTTIFQ